MAKLPIYEQQTLPQGGRADASMMGAATGQAIAQAGGVLADIGAAMKRREDVIDRTIRARDLDSFAQEAIRGLEPSDLARQETFDKYSQGLRAKADELMAGHGGTPQSRAEFKNQVENQISQYTRGAKEAQHKAQLEMIGTTIEQRTNQLATEAGFAPDMIGEIFDEIDFEIEKFGDALPAGIVQQYKNSARGAIAQTAIQRLQSEENFQAADRLIKNPDIAKHLPPNVSRQLTITNAAGQGKQAEAQRQVDNRVLRMRSIMPNMTPDQEAILRAQPPKSERTPFDDIIDYQLLNPNEKPPQALVDKAFNLARTGGDSTIERNMTIIKDNADRIASGLASQDEYRSFVNAVEILGRPRVARDMYNRPVTIPGGVPSYALEALDSWNRNVQGAKPTREPRFGGPTLGDVYEPMAGDDMGEPFMTEGPDGQMREDFPAFEPQPGEPGYEEAQQAGMAGQEMTGQPMTPDGMAGQAAAAPAQRPTYESAAPGMLTADQSIMDLAPLLVGPEQGMAALLQKIPGFGSIPKGHYQEAKTRVKTIQEAATLALRPTSKIADQYRRELKAIIDLRNAVFNTPEAAWRHITALDNTFRTAMQDHEAVMQGRVNASPAQVQEAAEQHRQLDRIVKELDVPQVRIRTNREYDALPPGTRFFSGDSHQPLTKR
jgi:hypothetical protein